MNVRRHGPSRRICVMAGCEDLPEVAALFAGLPADSYGQAFLVRPGVGSIPVLAGPDRVMVTWLTPATRPGDEVCSALSHWMAEWGEAMPAERPTVWIGPSIRQQLADLDLRCLDLAGAAYVAAPCPIVDEAPVTGHEVF